MSIILQLVFCGKKCEIPNQMHYLQQRFKLNLAMNGVFDRAEARVHDSIVLQIMTTITVGLFEVGGLWSE